MGQRRSNGEAAASPNRQMLGQARRNDVHGSNTPSRGAAGRPSRREEDVTDGDGRARRTSPSSKRAAPTRTPRRAASTTSADAEVDTDERSSPSASPSKKRRRTSLTLKLPAASTSSHTSDAREERARQRAQLQDARLVALEKRRLEKEASKEQDRLRVKDEPETDAEDDDAVVLAAPSNRMTANAPASSSRQPLPPPAPGYLPTPSSPSTVSPILPAAAIASSASSGPSSFSRLSAKDPSLSSAVPDISTFLASLPLPALTRLTPHFHALGCRSPSDLLVLADQSRGVKAREKVLDRVGKMDGGLSEWERIVLEEELEAGWKRWKGREREGAAQVMR